MNFRTEIKPSKILDLDLKTKFYSIGSCFANMIGKELTSNKFSCISNPFGIIYNPISIFSLLSNTSDFENSMIENDGIWYNYNLHSDFRHTDKQTLIDQIKQVQEESKTQLASSNVLVITLGSAFVYKLLDSNMIVANCHKIPQKQFSKYLLTVEDITTAFKAFYNTLQKTNPDIKIILTVSPVRHIKDTIELNSVSKSVLRLACHQLQSENKNVNYFSSYELMMDDLRDYRFYKDDLLHPTPFAENYIWDKFKESIFNNEALDFFDEWHKIQSAINHKPFNPKSENHQYFLIKQLNKLKELNVKVDCLEEIELVEKQLTL